MSVVSVAALLCAVLASSCDEDEPSARLLLGSGCSLNSDCDVGLACVFSVCHAMCASSKDCDGGRCVLDESKHHVCVSSAATCSFHSDCDAPLVCGLDGTCRNECAADRDCVVGQRCVAATCVELAELDDDGRLPSIGSPEGKPCSYSSDCPPEGELVLACREGRCRYACFEDVDCGKFTRCSTAADPDAPGNCELIGPAESLVCDPAFDPPVACPCPDGANETATCSEDGTGYLPCECTQSN